MARQIGLSVERLEDPALLRGQMKYLDDLELPGQLHVAFLRSEHAHARITRLDVTRARALPGVHAVITMEDMERALGRVRMPLSASPTLS
jgi:carbon-monoxide dehydrogenase large subunit